MLQVNAVCVPAPPGADPAVVKVNKAMMKKVVEDTGGKMLEMEDFMQELRAPGMKEVKSMTLSRTQLVCGDSDVLGQVFKANVWVSGLTVEAKMQSMKKLVVNTNGIDENLLGHQAEVQTVYSYKEPRDENEEGEVFDKKAGDLTNAFYYGKQLVPMGEVDTVATSQAAPKELTLLAVKKSSEISAGDAASSSMWVHPTPNDPIATLAVKTLCQALEEEESVMLIRYVKDARGNGKLAILTPFERKGIPGFVMHFKPYYEESKALNFVPLPNSTADQDAATDALIDAMDLDAFERKDLFTPETTYNPVLHHFRLNVAKRACDTGDEKKPIDPPNEVTKALYTPPEDLLVAAKAAIDAFKRQHPTEKILENVDKKRSAFGLDETHDEAAKRIKLEEEAKETDTAAGSSAELTVAGMMSKTPSDKLAVRSGEPLADFEEMVSRTDTDLWEKACKELSAVVPSLVSQSVRDLNYDKALGAVVGMRKHCVVKGDASSYNSLLRSLKDLFAEGARAAFWKLVYKGESNTLISSDEVTSSSVGAVEAKAFLEPPKATVVVKAEATVEEDDMLDDFD